MWMKLGVAVVVVVLLAVATLGKARTAVQREFVSGGTVRLNLEAGDYTVLASKGDRIRVAVDDAPRGAFNVSKDGFFRSFEWTGDGQYDLRAHLTVGELNLAP